VKYIHKETSGQYNLDCELNKIIAAVRLLEGLKCPDTIIELEQLTQTELEATLEQLTDYCNCIQCMDDEDIIDDTLPTGLNELLHDDDDSILLS